MKVGIIGAGAMGQAIVAALLRSGLVTPDDLSVADVIAERVESLNARHRIRGARTNVEVSEKSDYLIIALKPQDFDKAAPALSGHIEAGVTAVSIMAGVPLARLTGLLDHAAFVRAMPNTPAQIGQGMTVWTATESVTEEARGDVGHIFETMGRQAFVADERYIDMVTAVSGSGPGYVFLFIESLVDAAVHIGLPRDLATEIVIQTVAGSALFAQETGRHPADLRNLVTSPGGTTAEGLLALESSGFRAATVEAVIAAYNRSIELGEQKA